MTKFKFNFLVAELRYKCGLIRSRNTLAITHPSGVYICEEIEICDEDNDGYDIANLRIAFEFLSDFIVRTVGDWRLIVEVQSAALSPTIILPHYNVRPPIPNF